VRLAAGIAVAVLGAAMWAAASMVTPALFREGDENLFGHPLASALVVLGFLLMVGGPALLWWVLPSVGRLRRRSAAGK